MTSCRRDSSGGLVQPVRIGDRGGGLRVRGVLLAEAEGLYDAASAWVTVGGVEFEPYRRPSR